MESDQVLETTKEKIKTILKDKLFISLAIGGLFLNLAVLLAGIVFIKFDQSIFIAHYNVFLGIDKFIFDFNENFWEFFAAPIGGFVVWLINLWVAFMLFLTSLNEQLQYAGKAKNFKQRELLEEKGLYPKILSGYLLLSSSVAVAFAVGIHVLSIILVN